jgi:SAM-dependent methyltransferase
MLTHASGRQLLAGHWKRARRRHCTCSAVQSPSIQERTGLLAHHGVADGETASTLAHRASNNLPLRNTDRMDARRDVGGIAVAACLCQREDLPMLDTDDAELIRKVCQTAEHYFKVLERPEVLFNKPYVPYFEAPLSLDRLAAMIRHLRLGPHQRVLDFGAGMCWLSGVLARMGCRPIALDVSATALALGARALSDLPTRHGQPAVVFKVFDGFTFPLPDESVDRVACFDAFHHVPNKTAVLAEMFRVLRPGGRVCFAEPGPGHGASRVSLSEVRQFGVLEDEVDPAELSVLARRVGFSRAYVTPVVESGSVEWPCDLDSGDAAAVSVAGVSFAVREFNTVLLKGDDAPDSRAPSRLASCLRIVDAPTVVAPGDTWTARVSVTNIGDTVWLALPDYPRTRAPSLPRSLRRLLPSIRDFVAALTSRSASSGSALQRPVDLYRQYIEQNEFEGMVTLGVHLLNADGSEMLDRDYARGFFARAVPPDGVEEVMVRMHAPEQPGLYRLEFDPVDEYVTWFADRGSQVARDYLRVDAAPRIRDSRSPGILKSTLSRIASSSATRVVIEARNLGDTIWLAGPLSRPGEVQLGVQVVGSDGAVIERDWRRIALPRCVHPGEAVTLDVDLDDPPEALPIRLRFDLVVEGVSWFEDLGSTPLTVETGSP